MAAIDIDKLTDEEIQNMNPPEINPEDKTTEEPKDPVPDETTQDGDSSSDNESTDQQEPEESGKEESFEPEGKEDQPDNQTQNAPAVDYKGFYEAVMKPIKANGKELQLRDPSEAIKLMQMGANYTQKMQTIAPYRKKIQMLQNAGLLDDEKLNYLIDLSQGNKEAVKKLLKDTKLDPLDMDMESSTAYTPSNHSVSDSEVQFQAIVDDLKSTPEGVQTLQLVQGWDQASLNEIWQSPSMLATLNEQRRNGVFDFINNEIEHQKMLGNIPEGTPFLQAYKSVGDYCLKRQQAMAQQQQQAVQNLPQGTLNHPSSNSAQVKSAAPSGRSKKSAQRFVDPFSLSDEEFEKQFKEHVQS